MTMLHLRGELGLMVSIMKVSAMTENHASLTKSIPKIKSIMSSPLSQPERFSRLSILTILNNRKTLFIWGTYWALTGRATIAKRYVLMGTRWRLRKWHDNITEAGCGREPISKAYTTRDERGNAARNKYEGNSGEKAISFSASPSILARYYAKIP